MVLPLVLAEASVLDVSAFSAMTMVELEVVPAAPLALADAEAPAGCRRISRLKATAQKNVRIFYISFLDEEKIRDSPELSTLEKSW